MKGKLTFFPLGTVCIIAAILSGVAGCSQNGTSAVGASASTAAVMPNTSVQSGPATASNGIRGAAPNDTRPGWMAQLDTIFGWQGKIESANIERFSLIPQIKVTFEEGIQASPPLVLDGYASFEMLPNGNVLLVGELPLLDQENSVVEPVMDRINAGGIIVTALHNHLLSETPSVVYMHFSKAGSAAALAQTVVSAMAASKETYAKDDDSQDSDDTTTLDVKTLTSIVQETPSVVDGVLEYTAEPRVFITEFGYAMPGPMGPESELDFQAAKGGAVAVFEFALTEDQVDPVVRYLRNNHFDVTAVHNHWLLENPRIIFVHANEWGSPAYLAKVGRAVLSMTNQK
ncbi:MAG: DUF1259 domain-containing protein [Candidatus Eremiobacteraeota bacterium]|nr:DUF1259 domain-containing protein [Candidatus Eremiobacteraeota bacterium]